LYPDSIHVAHAGLLKCPDREIWEFATTIGPPPKVVWLRRWAHPTRDAERVLRREAIRITEFAADPELAVLVLDRD
jgi:predicted nuclease of predicted toxin-antitoxin system